MPRLAAPEPLAANLLPVLKHLSCTTTTTRASCSASCAIAAPSAPVEATFKDNALLQPCITQTAPQGGGDSFPARAVGDVSVGGSTSSVTTPPVGQEASMTARVGSPCRGNVTALPRAVRTDNSVASELLAPDSAQRTAATSGFRPLGDVLSGVSSAALGSLVLAALVVTVRTARHGLAVLLSVGSCGVDLLGAAHIQGSRDAMHKRVETQVGDFLGATTPSFLAFEENFSGHTLRCYACPLEHTVFDALALDVAFVTNPGDFEEANLEKDVHANSLILTPLTALHGLACKRHCLHAAAAVDTMRTQEYTSPHAARSYPVDLSTTTFSVRNPNGWALRMRRHEASQNLVRAHLREAARISDSKGLPSDAEELVASAERVGENKVTDLSAIPFELRGPDKAVQDAAWRHARFSPVLEAPVTKALPRTKPQPQTTWRPSTVEDLFMPGVWAKVQAWCDGNAKDLLWMREHGADGKRPHKQQSLFLAQSDMVPEARGIVWDLRRASDGIIEPWDFTAPITSDLNLDFLEVLLSTCPDQELRSHLRHGVDFKADLPLQTVLMPHLNSIAENVDLCEREIDRLRGKGWSTAFSMLPALPCRLLPCGSVSRKHEPGRPRRTLNASAPHHLYYDADGVLVLSLNAAIKHDGRTIHGRCEDAAAADSALQAAPRSGVAVPVRAPRSSANQSTWEDWRAECVSCGENPFTAPNRPQHLQPSHDKWPKELKPLVMSKLHDITVLRHAGLVFNEEVVGMSTDFADYFSQLSLAPSVLWMHVVHWAGLEGCNESSLGTFVLDQRLGFGASASSNIGQRLSHSLNSVFRLVFDAQEAKILAAEVDPKRVAWIADRRALGHNQCRLYEICTYTDDPFLVCVGPARLARAVGLWNRLLKAIGIAVAIPVKRQFGAAVRWLGLDFYLSLGIVVVPENKRLRALTSLMSMASGAPMTFAAYQSATSFLQYLKPFIAGADGTYFYGLYEPYSRGAGGQSPNPADIVAMTPAIREQAQRWAQLLRSTAGMYASSIRAPQAPSEATPLLHLYSDAALEGAAVPGLGGYMHGFYWAIPLHGDELLLPISVLELVAIGINLITFDELARGARVVLCSDSLNSVQVLTNLRAKSPLMAHVHLRILELPQAKSLGGSTSAVHCFGSANPLADAVSRGNMEYFHALCSQLGVAPSETQVPLSGRQLLDDAVDYARSNGLLNADKPARTKRSAAQLANEHHYGNAFSSDEDGDGPSRLQEVHQPSQQDLSAFATGATVAAAAPPTAPRRSMLGVMATPSVEANRADAEFTGIVLTRSVHGNAAPLPAAALEVDSLTFGKMLAGSSLVQPQATPAASLLTDTPIAAAMPWPTELGDLRPETAPRYASHKRAMSSTSVATKALRNSEWSSPLLCSTMPRLTPAAQRRRNVRLGCLHERALHLASALQNDLSPLALRPRDSGALQQLCLATLQAAESAPAHSTTKADDLAWERWCAYCDSMGTPPFRINNGSCGAPEAASTERETALLCGFLLYLADTMSGRGCTGNSKPQSNFQMVLAVRRVHERMGARMEVLQGVRRVYDSLLKNFVATEGAAAVAPSRKEPLDGPRLTRIFSLPDGTKIGAKTLRWSDGYWISWRALLSCGFAAAFRKAELLPAQHGISSAVLTRASVSWIISGVPVANPTHAQLENLVQGDYCVIVPPTSKADPFGLIYTTKPIYMPFADKVGNAAKSMAILFLEIPIPVATRAAVPLFCFDTDGTTMGHSEASRVLQYALKAAFPFEDSARWSMHSLRIGAATALLKAGASMEMIQALCRWRSPKSVGIYARLGATDYGTWLNEAQRQHTDASTTRNLPRLDYDGIIASLAGPMETWDEHAL